MRKPKHGELCSGTNPEAWAIWNTRDEEPPLCEPFKWSYDYIVDNTLDDAKEVAAILLQRIQIKCMGREEEVINLRLDGLTYKEIADQLKLSRERIRQIEARGLRRLIAGLVLDSSFLRSRRKDFQHPGYAWDEVPEDLPYPLREQFKQATYAAPNNSWIVLKTTKGYELFYWTMDPNVGSKTAQWHNANRGPFKSTAEATAFVANFKGK
jgi:hypothetical protein